MRALLVAIAVFVFTAPVSAAEWQTIRAGESTQAQARTQFGAATKTTSQKVEGYDSVQWLYEGGQAPKGVRRLTIDFGILTPQGYRPDVVRQMLVEPAPGVFVRPTVLAGWGEPDGVATEGEAKVMSYRSGLFVYFDKDGWNVERMYFTPPQPATTGAPPRR